VTIPDPAQYRAAAEEYLRCHFPPHGWSRWVVFKPNGRWVDDIVPATYPKRKGYLFVEHFPKDTQETFLGRFERAFKERFLEGEND
jgi:hypothetical protein